MPEQSYPAVTDPVPTGPAHFPDPAATTITRAWDLRRRAEERGWWARPAVGVFVAAGFVVIADPGLLPGGLPVSIAGFVAVAAVAIGGIVMWARRASMRGHSGTVDAPDAPGSRWWRSPALVGPALYSVVFLGNLTGLFEHWPIIIGCAVVVGVAVSFTLPRYETADHLTGSRLEHPPALTAGAAADVAEGGLSPDVLELMILQHHTGERRVSWCADVLDTDPADIRGRIARGRRWLELPATEVHDPATAEWVRLSADGRAGLGYI